MPFIARRVFYTKAGMAEPLVQHHKEGDTLLLKYGVNLKTRVLIDHNGGRSTKEPWLAFPRRYQREPVPVRVVVEWEVEDLGDLDAAIDRIMKNPEANGKLQAWESQILGMIYYSEAETWASC